jgi:hypothetical protein
MEGREMTKATQLSNRQWWMVVFVLWALAISAPALDRFIPGAFWMSVHSVHINDARVGMAPTMKVDRTVRRKFRAHWIAEIERKTARGFEVIPSCIGRGVNNYGPDQFLPDDLDLDWWIFPTTCKLEPGQYRVETIWVLDRGQVVSAVSNVFTIYP